jgi:hypothetical protein
MLHNAVIRNGYDLGGVRRVAGVLLRHVRPRSRSEALTLLDEKLGVFIFDRTVLDAEVSRYFAGEAPLAA